MASAASAPVLPVDTSQLTLKDGKVICQICLASLGFGASRATAVSNYSKHVLENKKCLSVQQTRGLAAPSGSRTAKPKIFDMKSFFTQKPKILAQPTVPPVPSAVPKHPPPPAIPPTPLVPSLPPVSPPRPIPPILLALRCGIDRLEGSLPVADASHPFASFGSYDGSVPPGEDAWEIWDRPIINALGAAPLRELLATGPNGLDALYELLLWLVSAHNLPAAMLEGKIQRVLDAMQEIARENNLDLELTPRSRPTTPPAVPRPQPPSFHPPSRASSPIDIDTLPDLPDSSAAIILCSGLSVEFPDGVSAYEGYPHGLHSHYGDPWDVRIRRGAMAMFSPGCTTVVSSGTACCAPCRAIRHLPQFDSVQRNILRPAGKSANLKYRTYRGLLEEHRKSNKTIKSLRLNKFNDGKRIASRSSALAKHKQWVRAVASGQVVAVDRLARTALKNGAGIATLLKRYEDAAKQVYKPKSYAQEDYLRGLLILRLGGARLAKMAHRMLGLPAVDTLRRHSIIPTLIPSIAAPTIEEVQRNLNACFEGISDALASSNVVHQVVMFDELKTEPRLRWEPKTNSLVGVCREHSDGLPMVFKSADEPLIVIESIEAGRAHMAGEIQVTVGAVGLLTDDSALLSARTGLISGSCKRESGEQHAKVIKTTIDAAKVTKVRTICVATDGESRRGEAFVRLTMKRELAPSSPIYSLLHILEFMDFLVGDDDLTGDKDHKHVVKRERNWLLRKRGLRVLDLDLNIGVIRKHLASVGIPLARLDYLFKPDDKQDVQLSYELLSEIWRLLPADASGLPRRFVETREVLRMLGSLFRHLLFPYICPELSLSEQLRHLSAAAHLLLALWHKTNAGTAFMPSQLYLDIMILIKNVFFCVAKAQVDDPDGRFWIILLGTDRLEELFGILRTIVGNDSNVDILQFSLRATATTEVATITAQRPEWSDAPRRLKLPVLSRDDVVISSRQDHIKPKDWIGDVHVSLVNIHTCWLLGRRDIAEEFPILGAELDLLSSERQGGAKINILRPFGVDMVHAERAADDVDDSAPDYIDPDAPMELVDPLTSSTPSKDPDFEDAIIEQGTDESVKHPPTFELDGKQVYKASYLNELVRRHKNPVGNSRDRLRRVADMPRHLICSTAQYSDVVCSDPDFNATEFAIDLPVITLLKCEEHFFVCVGEITDIVCDGEHLPALSAERVTEPATQISWQLLYIRRAAEGCDPDGRSDWIAAAGRGKSYTVPGFLVELIDADLYTPEGTTSANYLFSSQDLMAIGGLIFGRLTKESVEGVPSVARSMHFPYKDSNEKLCFICDDEAIEAEIAHAGVCAHCSKPVKIKSMPAIINHNSGHIKFDSRFDPVKQPCPLCLQLGVCKFVLRATPGGEAEYQVDLKKSVCPALRRFSYATASQRTDKNPATNVPRPCPVSHCKAVVWSYNLEAHVRAEHPSLHSHFKDQYAPGKTEKKLLLALWSKRFKKGRKSRKGQSAGIEHLVSDRHRTSRAIRDNEEDDSGGEDVPNDAPIEDNDSTWDIPRDDSEEGEDVPGDDEEDGLESDEDEDKSEDEENPTLDNGSESESPVDNDPSPQASAAAIPAPLLPTPSSATAASTSGMQTRHRQTRTHAEAFMDCGACALAVTNNDKRSDAAIECSQRGCESRWFHTECVGLDAPLLRWMCDACKASR